MKKFLGMAAFCFLMLNMCFMEAQAKETQDTESEAAAVLEQIKEELGDVFEDLDQETAGEIFSFVKEKISDGALDSEEGISQAIEEGEEKFGVKIDRQTAKQVVETMEKLEKLGFSSEKIVDKAADLYQQYGADFVEHVDEVVKDAVKGAVKKAADSFWENLKVAVSDFFQNLF